MTDTQIDLLWNCFGSTFLISIEEKTHIYVICTHTKAHTICRVLWDFGGSPVHESAVQVFCSLCHMILKQGGRSQLKVGKLPVSINLKPIIPTPNSIFLPVFTAITL
jgi:hypothetical protein